MTKTFGKVINEDRIANGLNPINFSVSKYLVREDRIGDSVINQYEGEPVFLRRNTNDIIRELAFKIFQDCIKSHGNNVASATEELNSKYGYQMAILAMMKHKSEEKKAHPQFKKQLSREYNTLGQLEWLRSLLVDNEFIDEVIEMTSSNDVSFS